MNRTTKGFNPRAPRGARQSGRKTKKLAQMFQSTRPARGATFGRDGIPALIIVSIHAPRAGRDSDQRAPTAAEYVSIHAPRAGRDAIDDIAAIDTIMFQSTRPARGATILRQQQADQIMFQSTRPARGATPAFARS